MIPFLNLKKLNQPFEIALQEKMEQFLTKGWYILGNEVKTFEAGFAAHGKPTTSVAQASSIAHITIRW